MPYGSGHTLLGAMPATVHAAPRDVAVVGLGSGDTAWASAWRPETRSLTVFEISAPQPRILWRLVGFVDMTDTRHLLEDPRLRIRIEDGRKALEAGADTLRPDRDRRHLARDGGQRQPVLGGVLPRCVAPASKPGGLMCTWAPTPRVVATFRAVFPHVLEARGRRHADRQPRADPVAPEAWAARAAPPAAYLGAARMRDVVGGGREAAAGRARRRRSRLNRDLFPRDEYAVQ